MSRSQALRVGLAAVRRRRSAALRLLLWSGPEALPAALSGLVIARAVDRGFLAGRPVVGLVWLALSAVVAVLGAAGSRQVYRQAGAIVEPLRDELVRHVVSQALRRAGNAGARPDTAAVARLTHQVEGVRDSFAGLLLVTRGFVVTAVAAVVGVLSLDLALLPMVVGPLLAGLALFLVALRAAARGQLAYLLADEDLASSVGETLAAARDVAACRAEDRVAAMVGTRIDAQRNAERSLARLAAARSVSVGVGGWLPVALVLAAAGWPAGRGMTAGTLLGALTYVSQALRPALATFVHSVGSAGLRYTVTLERILGHDDPVPRQTAGAVPNGTGLVLRRVCFRYGPAAEPVLKDLDLTIPEGDHLAVVGPSGIGKSTLAALVCGTIPAQSGQVLLGGRPVAELGMSTLAGVRVLIPQEAYVFAGTLAENLTYLRPEARADDLSRAVQTLGAAALVHRIGGYQAQVCPGDLSAGERQLIALVRAYLSPARVAVLDEATCHLDPASEERVERAFASRGGTLVVIAHRISSAARARRVLVLDGHRAVLGDHATLVSRSGLYRDLAGYWAVRSESEPTGLPGDADRVDPGTGPQLHVYPGEVVAHGAGREE